MSAPERGPRPAGGEPREAKVFVLPTMDAGGAAGGRMVRRAVTFTFALLGAVAAAAAGVALTVSMDVTVDAAGVLEPVRVWPARTREAGLVREVLVRSGDTVARGQVVARLDRLQLEDARDRLRAQYESRRIEYRALEAAAPLERAERAEQRARAEARVIAARAALRQRLVEGGLGDDVDAARARYRPGRHVAVDLAMAELLNAESEVRAGGAQLGRDEVRRLELARVRADLAHLQGQLRVASERLARTEVVAPAAGVVLGGQPESLAGASVREGDPIVEVADVSRWRVVMLVPEGDVSRVRVGDRVQLEVQAFAASEREPLRARVVSVGAEPQGSGAARPEGDAGPKRYRVEAALEGAGVAADEIAHFRRGYTVRGRIVTRSGRIATVMWDHLVGGGRP